MAVYNPRLDLARAAKQQATSASVQTLKSVLNQQTIGSTLRKDYTNGGAGAQGPPDVGGWKGFLTDVLESPVGQVVAKAGEVISIPQRLLISPIKEIKDYLDNDPNTKASWDDLGKQVFDPTFGFGKVIGDLTDSAWVNRGLGFVGDVLLDPLTYVTLGGGKIAAGMKQLDEFGNVMKGAKGISMAGKEGRLALATRYLDKGGDASKAAAIARYGRSALDAKDFTDLALGVDRAGLYFMGKRIKGTTRLGEGFEKGFSSMRTWSGDHVFKRAAELFTPEDAAAARKALARGTAPPERAEKYLRTVISLNNHRAESAKELRYAQGEIYKMVEEIGTGEWKLHSKNVYKILEGQASTSTGAALDAEMRIAERVKQMFGDLWSRVDNSALATDPAAPIGKIENYFPHTMTDDAYRFIADKSNDNANNLRDLLFNPLDNAGAFKHRMQLGDEFFGTVLEKPEQLTIDGLNTIARDGGFKGDFFESDINRVLDKYSAQYGDQMGIIARRKYLVDTGVLQEANAKLVFDKGILRRQQRLVNRTVAQREKNLGEATKIFDDLGDTLLKHLNMQADSFEWVTNEAGDFILDAAGKRIKAPLQRMRDEARNIILTGAKAKQFEWSARQGLDAALTVLRQSQDSLRSLYDDIPEVVRVAESRLTATTERIRVLDEKIAAGQVEVADIIEESSRIKTELQGIQQSEQLLQLHGNVLNNHLDRIANMDNVDDLAEYADLINAARTPFIVNDDVQGTLTARVQGRLTPTKEEQVNPMGMYNTMRRNIKNEAITLDDGTVLPAGQMSAQKERILSKRYRDAGGQFEDDIPALVDTDLWRAANPEGLTPASRIDPSRVTQMNAEKLRTVVNSALRGEASIRDMRTAVLRIAAEGNISYDELIEVAEQSARIDDFFTRLLNARKNSKNFVVLQSAKDDLGKFSGDIKGAAHQYIASAKLVGQLEQAGADPTALVPVAMLQEFLDRPEYESLRALFDPYLQEEVDYAALAGMTQVADAGEIAGVNAFDQPASVVRMRQGDVVAPFAKEADQVEPLTFGQMTDILRRSVDSSMAQEFTITVGGGGQMAGLINQQGRTLNVRINDYLDMFDEHVDNFDSFDTIDQSLDEWINADPRSLITGRGTVRGGGEEIGFPTMVDRPDMFGDGIKRDAADGMMSLRQEIRNIQDELDSFNVTYFDSKTGKPLDLQGNKLDVNTSSLAQKAADEAKKDLQRHLVEIYFKAEVTKRQKLLVNSLAPFGLVPTQDYMRRVVNSVAKHFGNSANAEARTVNRGLIALRDVLQEVERQDWTGREAELFDVINKAINGSGAGAVVSKFGNRSDAKRLLREWRIRGGVGKDTGRAGQLLKERRALIEGTPRYEQVQKEIFELSQERVRFTTEQLVPWYYAAYGDNGLVPTNPEIMEALKTLAEVKTNYGNLAADATARDQIKWVRTVIKTMEDHQLDFNRNSRWLSDAADPFINLDNLVIGGVKRSRRGTTDRLPSLYAYNLTEIADDWEKGAARLASAESASAQAIKAQADFAAQRQTAEQILAANVDPSKSLPQSFDGANQLQLERALRAHQDLVTLQSGIMHSSAKDREELHSILSDLARYNIAEDTPFTRIESPTAVAKKLLQQGTPIYVKKGEVWKEVKSIDDIVEGTNYAVHNQGAGLKDVNAVNKAHAGYLKFQKEHEVTVNLVATAEKKVKDIDARLVAARTKPKNVKDLYEVADIENELLAAKKELEAARRTNSEDYKRMMTAKSSFDSSMNIIGNGGTRPVMVNGEQLTLSQVEFESLFISGGDKKAVDALLAKREAVRTRQVQVAKKEWAVNVQNYLKSLDEIGVARGAKRVANRSYAGVDTGRQVLKTRAANELKAKIAAVEENLRLMFEKEDIGDILFYQKSIQKQIRNLKESQDAILGDLVNQSRIKAGYRVEREALTGNNAITRGIDDFIDKANKRMNALVASTEESGEKLVELQKWADHYDILVSASRPEQQSAALAKLHQVVRAINNGEMTREEFMYGFEKVNKNVKQIDVSDKISNEILEKRVKFLNDSWLPSVEKKHMDAEHLLENSVQKELWDKSVSTATDMTDHANKLRLEAEKASGRFSDPEAPYGYDYSLATGTYTKREAPVVGVAGAQKNIDDLSVQSRRTLQNITSSTDGVVDAEKMYSDLLAAGKSEADAMRAVAAAASEAVPASGANKLLPAGTQEAVDTALKYPKGRRAAVERMTDELKVQAQIQDMADELQIFNALERAAFTELANNRVTRNFMIQVADGLKQQIEDIVPWERELIAGERKVVFDEYQNFMSAWVTHQRAAIALDQSRVAREELPTWWKTYAEPIRKERDRVLANIADIEKNIPRDANGRLQMAELLDWLDNNDTIFDGLLSYDQMNVIDKLRIQAQGAHMALINSQDQARDAIDAMRALRNGEWGASVVRQAKQGFVTLEKIGMPSYQAEKWLAEMLTNFSRFEQPEFVRGINKFLGRYTSFFKAGAVGTPGFVVRNALGNTFMIVAAGADLRNMNKGIELYRLWNAAVKRGGEEAWLSTLEKSEQALVRNAVRAMDASGYGRAADALKGFRPKRKWLTDNRMYTALRKANEYAEGSARFMLAYDSVVKGADFNMATARVKRYLFDYATKSPADQVMGSIVPFWFWMSRNLPLQIANQYQNPRAYLMYQKGMRAIGQDDSEDVVPSWMKEQGAVKLTSNWFLSPDLGFNRVNEQLQQFAEPKRLLSYVNPALRVPFETLLSEKRLYNDVPFTDRPQQAIGGPLSPAVQALASVLGQSRQLPDGQQGVTDKLNYGLMGLIPQIAQGERLLPATDLYQGRQAGSILSFLGVPVRQVTPEMRDREKRRQVMESEALRNIAIGGQ